MILAKKSLGQNFLIDKNVVKKIIHLSKIKNQHIVEIGPGKGSLTREILQHEPRSLTIIEKDNRLAQELGLDKAGISPLAATKSGANRKKKKSKNINTLL